MGQPSPSAGKTDRPLIYDEVCRDLKTDPLKPDKRSRELDTLTKRIDKGLLGLKKLAAGE